MDDNDTLKFSLTPHLPSLAQFRTCDCLPNEQGVEVVEAEAREAPADFSWSLLASCVTLRTPPDSLLEGDIYGTEPVFPSHPH